jgi:BirA family biotin operon repressor/biotin-[acetyl-CoA-carboxylase] ligase
VGTDTPRAALNKDEITREISQYWRVSVAEVTDSTQDDIAEAITSSRAQSGDVIVANYQRSGRGRLQRTFLAAPDTALTFSLYLTPHREKSQWSFLPLLAGVAVAQSLNEDSSSEKVTLKWPNDLMINEKKVGGIISQAIGDGVAIGIGINISMTEEELPVEGATSLALHNFLQVNRNQILSSLLNTFEEIFKRWDQGISLRSHYSDLSSTIGSLIKAELPDGSAISGRALEISESGELVLDNGKHISVGDIIHLR